MASFKDNAESELLTVLPKDPREVRAFLSAAAKQGGYIHIVGRRRNLVFGLSSYAECLAVVELLKTMYPTEFEISAEHVKAGMKKGSTAFSVSVPTGFAAQALRTRLSTSMPSSGASACTAACAGHRMSRRGAPCGWRRRTSSSRGGSGTAASGTPPSSSPKSSSNSRLRRSSRWDSR